MKKKLGTKIRNVVDQVVEEEAIHTHQQRKGDAEYFSHHSSTLNQNSTPQSNPPHMQTIRIIKYHKIILKFILLLH